MHRRKLAGLISRPALIAITLALLITGIALAFTLASVDGIWTNGRTTSGGSTKPHCYQENNTVSVTDENQVRYGEPYVGGVFLECDDWDEPIVPERYVLKSGFGFDGSEGLDFEAGDVFLLGKFTHYNNPIGTNNLVMSYVDLNIDLDFSDPDVTEDFDFTVRLDETNNDDDCEYPGSSSCPDKVWFENLITSKTFQADGKTYTLQILGFGAGTSDPCPEYTGQTIFNEFITEEQQSNYACLYGKIVEAGITIVKDADPDHFRDFQFDIVSDASPALDETFYLDDDEGCADEGPSFCDAYGNVLSDTKNFPGLPAGTYTITESFDPTLPWATNPPDCTGTTNFTWTPNGEARKGGTLVIELAEDENVVCTFSNVSDETTAVTLKGITAQSVQTSSALVIGGLLAASAILVSFLAARRKNRATN